LNPSLGGFLGVFSGPCSWGFNGGNLWEPFVVLFGEISSIRLDLTSFGGIKLGYGHLMSDSGDQSLDLGELTRGCCSS
jgi:hypothetical protein